MKKLLLSLCIATISTTAISAQNLIQNGDFEGLATLHQPKAGEETISYTNNNPNAPLVSAGFNYKSGDTQWRLKQPNTGYIRTDYYTDDVYTGTQSLKLAISKGYVDNLPWYNNVVYQSVSVDPTKAYEVKLWAKGNTKLFAQFFTDGTAIGGQPSKVLEEGVDWAQYTFSLDVVGRDNSAVVPEKFTTMTIFALGMQATPAEMADDTRFVWVDDVEVLVVKKEDPSGIHDANGYKVPFYVNNKTIYFNIEDTHKVSIYNALGSLVKSQYIAPGQSLPVEMEGCYIIKLENSIGAKSTQKLLIK